MNQLSSIASQSAPGAGTQFRRQPYGAGNIRDFLRDVMALANASVDGPRHIVVGAEFDARGRRRIAGVAGKDFSGKPAYAKLVREYIEPEIRLRYEAVTVGGKQLGVFEIGECRDRPYMMRVDYSEDLRRGDAYMRVNDAAIKMGRRQLQTLFESRFRDTVAGTDLEVGFPGEIIHKNLQIGCCDLEQLPSAVAASKLEQLIKIQLESKDSGSTSIMARLVHARLFGSDDPYVRRTPDELMQELKQIRDKYEDQDREFLFETNASEIQLVVLNQGRQPITDASLTLVLPADPDFYVADARNRPGRSDARADSNDPQVRLLDNSIHVRCGIGDLAVGEPVTVFGSPLKVCAGPGMRGRKFGLRYAVLGSKLRSPAQGRLRLLFR